GRPRAVHLAGQLAAAGVHDAVRRVRHPDIRGGAAAAGRQRSGQFLLAAGTRHHGVADADSGARARRAALAVDRGCGPPPARLAAGAAVAVKFPRQFAAVVLTVAVIVGLGLLCAHVAGDGPDPGSALRRPPSHAALVRLERAKAGRITVRADNGIRLANAGDLVKTGMT